MRVVVREVLGGEALDLLELVVVAVDGIDELRERPHDPSRHERVERDVEIAAAHVEI